MFTEDLTPFFNVAEFAETVTRANATTFPAIFDARYADPLGVAGAEPAITTREAVALVRGETLTIRGANYVVRTIEPDGTGVVVARLSRA